MEPFFSLTGSPTFSPCLIPRTYRKGRGRITLWPLVHYAPQRLFDDVIDRLEKRETIKVYELICSEEVRGV